MSDPSIMEIARDLHAAAEAHGVEISVAIGLFSMRNISWSLLISPQLGPSIFHATMTRDLGKAVVAVIVVIVLVAGTVFATAWTLGIRG